ncbi:MAG: 30S ribosomal protein S17 [Sedimentisphaerales bacterium]|nr:30S ribosomal protein S17 [Sedimentisphaerales bacterium]
MEQDKNKKLKAQTGVVISSSGDKTIKVAIDYKVRHPRYGKYVKRRIQLLVHDQKNQAAVNDIVAVVPSRPLSKTKSWRLLEVVEKGIEN